MWENKSGRLKVKDKKVGEKKLEQKIDKILGEKNR